MSEAHTPGPWKVGQDPQGSNPDIWIDSAGGILADIGGGILATRQANAALMAAAPDMLAALLAARSFGSQGDTDEGLSVSNIIDLAIAKAKGGA